MSLMQNWNQVRYQAQRKPTTLTLTLNEPPKLHLPPILTLNLILHITPTKPKPKPKPKMHDPPKKALPDLVH